MHNSGLSSGVKIGLSVGIALGDFGALWLVRQDIRIQPLPPYTRNQKRILLEIERLDVRNDARELEGAAN